MFQQWFVFYSVLKQKTRDNPRFNPKFKGSVTDWGVFVMDV
jgi:hypothetical protein